MNLPAIASMMLYLYDGYFERLIISGIAVWFLLLAVACAGDMSEDANEEFWWGHVAGDDLIYVRL